MGPPHELSRRLAVIDFDNQRISLLCFDEDDPQLYQIQKDFDHIIYLQKLLNDDNIKLLCKSIYSSKRALKLKYFYDRDQGYVFSNLDTKRLLKNMQRSWIRFKVQIADLGMSVGIQLSYDTKKQDDLDIIAKLIRDIQRYSEKIRFCYKWLHAHNLDCYQFKIRVNYLYNLIQTIDQRNKLSVEDFIQFTQSSHVGLTAIYKGFRISYYPQLIQAAIQEYTSSRYILCIGNDTYIALKLLEELRLLEFFMHEFERQMIMQ